MATFTPGLVHTPATPFKRDHSIDFDTYARLLEFHLRNGADALALPMPSGEDLSLTDAESRTLLRFAVREINGRVPVIAHVSNAGTAIAADRARFAEDIGAAAIASHPPYFWRPKPATVIEHLVQIGSATRLPFFMCSTLAEDVNTPLTTDIALQVVERLENAAGLVDSSMDWVFMTEVISLAKRTRRDFQLLPATDYIVSAAAVGASGAFSPLSAVAPKLVRQVYALCSRQQFMEARKPQEDLAALHYVVKTAGFGGFKGALRAMGRDCGCPRAPMNALNEEEQARLTAEIASMRFLDAEPRGW